MIRQARTASRQATGILATSNAVPVCPGAALRRSYATSSSTKSQASSAFPYAVGLIALAFGASAVISQFPSDKNRQAALRKLDTSNAAKQTPEPITRKAQEASSGLPPPAPSTFTPPSPAEPSVKGKDALKEKKLDAKDADAQAPGAEVHSQPASEVSEAEDGQAAAFNPETGEINWDCPCLGGMADGPCGEEFKAAFSCFVYSEEEPKGVDCVEKFKGMQDCFRLHPDIYGAELADDEEPEEGSPMPSAGSSAQSSPDTSISDLAKEAASALGDSAFSERDSDSPYTSSIQAGKEKAEEWVDVAKEKLQK